MSESAGIIVKVNDEILLCKRSESVNHGGYWSPPMGGVEKGESPAEAAVREFKEETNISIKGTLKKIIKLDNKITIFLSVKNNKIKPDLDNAKDGFEHSECGYFKDKDLDDLKINQKFLKVYREILN